MVYFFEIEYKVSFFFTLWIIRVSQLFNNGWSTCLINGVIWLIVSDNLYARYGFLKSSLPWD